MSRGRRGEGRLAVGCALAGALGGSPALVSCATEPAPRAANVTYLAPSACKGIALPSSDVLELASAFDQEYGADPFLGPEASRNDLRLGSPPLAAPTSVFFERDVNDRQLVLNGTSMPKYRQTLRIRERLVP